MVGNAQVSDGESLRRLALAGVGIARLSLFHIAPDIKAGRLVPLLENLNPGDVEEINAIFLRAFAPLLNSLPRPCHAGSTRRSAPE